MCSFTFLGSERIPVHLRAVSRNHMGHATNPLGADS